MQETSPSERWVLSSSPPPATARFAYGPSPSQFGELRVPRGDGPHPVAVVLHGGFWRSAYSLEHIGHLCAALSEAGVATWSLEYRRLGEPGGGWPGTLDDTLSGLGFLKGLAEKFGLELSRVVTVGHSAGGQLALWLAAQAQQGKSPVSIRGAVALAGVVDLVRAWELRLGAGIVETFLGGTPFDVAERYAHASPAALAPLPSPTLLIHGERDETVPAELSASYRSLAGSSCQLLAFPDSGHFEPIDPRTPEGKAVIEGTQRLLGW